MTIMDKNSKKQSVSSRQNNVDKSFYKLTIKKMREQLYPSR